MMVVMEMVVGVVVGGLVLDGDAGGGNGGDHAAQ